MPEVTQNETQDDVVITPEGFIEVIMRGPWNLKEAFFIGQKLITIAIKRNSDTGGLSKILVDFSATTEVQPIVVKLSTMMVPDIEDQKVAIFGANNANVEEAVTAIINGSNSADKHRLFKTREEAVKWLQE